MACWSMFGTAEDWAYYESDECKEAVAQRWRERHRCPICGSTSYEGIADGTGFQEHLAACVVTAGL
jgi:hypothetical protein